MSATAPNINSVTLVGQLTADPELRELPDGRPVCSLRLAVNDYRDKPPTFIDVTTFGDEAKACAEHLVKGRQIGVIGRLTYREWETNGAKRSKHEVVGRVAFGGKGESSAGNHVAGGERGSADESANDE
jgi:single-strand DNA-binding protein